MPGVLDKMRSELEYGDRATDMYWFCATSYFKLVFDEQAVTRVRLLASREEDESMRERLLSEVAPSMKYFVERELPQRKREQKMEWRRQRFRDAGEVPKF